ncbi:MAG: phosphatidylserine/phosphatidylglycerophosphate/cardiolipin synthase family protein [Bacteroidetes bacterium]|nr:phosphatidylserine/phosphatidylglycerophosphate/cardiolipin synthase family protein [Bacteroidota bacterium]
MEFLIIDDPLKFYNLMLNDIARAKRFIYLETYKFSNDHMGIKFRDALTRKAIEGLEIKILIDSWGKGPISESFFNTLIKNKGQVKFFEKIKISSDIFTRGHRRDHRKILVIDDEISYMGSMNITGYNLNWRELALRTKGEEMAVIWKKVFHQNFEALNQYIITTKLAYTKTIKFGEWEVVRDVPSMPLQRLRKKYVQLIKNAKSRIIIETPYFLPGFLLRKAMIDASKRGVDVKVILPMHSDVRMIDILRNRYLGMLYKNNIKLLFYTPNNLHAKLMVIDDRIFSISSANFDYRSFRYQYEIALIGTEQDVLNQLIEHISETLRNSEEFNYETWSKRPLIEKIFEAILVPFRHLL